MVANDNKLLPELVLVANDNKLLPELVVAADDYQLLYLSLSWLQMTISHFA